MKPTLYEKFDTGFKYIIDKRKCDTPKKNSLIMVTDFQRHAQSYRRDFLIVTDWELLNEQKEFDKCKPRLNKDEFMSSVTSSWVYPDLDHIDEYISYVLMSCPKGNFGVGGIRGDITADYGHPLSDLTLFHNDIKRMLPLNYTRNNKVYSFTGLSTKKKYSGAVETVLDRKYNEYSTASYPQKMELKICDLPSQFPVNLRNSMLRRNRSTDFDYDVYEYYVHSWYINNADFETLVHAETERQKHKLNARLSLHFNDLDHYIINECPSLNGVITLDSIPRLAIVLARMDQKNFGLDYLKIANRIMKKNLKRYLETSIHRYDEASALKLSRGATMILEFLLKDSTLDNYEMGRVPIHVIQQLERFRNLDPITFARDISELRMKDRILYHNNDTEISLMNRD